MLKKCLLAGLLLAAVTANAETVTAKVVADDHYKIFVGDASGASLTQVASSGSNLWFSQGASFNFDISAGQYIYVAAWDSASYGPPHAWIGEFDINGTKLYSNTTDWLGKNNNSIKDPSENDAETLATTGLWSALAASMPNGSSPYGSLIGSSPASFVWTDAFNGTSASQNGFALFRTKYAALGTTSAVPVPAALPLMLSGAGLLAFRMRRKG